MAMVSNAQQSKVEAATEFLQKNNLDSAKANINSAVANPETANDANAWYIRGFVYKAIFNKNEKADKKSPARIEALNSFKKSISFDDNKVLTTENVKAIKFLVNTLHNHAAEALDPVDYKIAIEVFEKFKEYYKLVDPSPETMQQKEIEFDLALASVYNTIIDGDKKGSAKFVTLAKNLYNKILTLDQDNIAANMGMAKLFYNQGVNLILAQELDLDIVNIDGVQDRSVKLFKESLPFMEKAYSLDQSRPETIEGLTGIYYSLHEDEKYTIFKKRLEDIKKPK